MQAAGLALVPVTAATSLKSVRELFQQLEQLEGVTPWRSSWTASSVGAHPRGYSLYGAGAQGFRFVEPPTAHHIFVSAFVGY